MFLPALAGFEKSLVDSSGHGALARLGPFGTESVSPCATVYVSFFILKVVLTRPRQAQMLGIGDSERAESDFPKEQNA